VRRILMGAFVLGLVSVFGIGCGDDDDDFEDGVGFNDFDVNEDGAISADEWDDTIDDWDIDDDGFLDDGEFLMDGGAFDAMDLNDDATVSGAEWADAFGAFDIDDDALLGADEFF
jgi:hypothetical protein